VVPNRVGTHDARHIVLLSVCLNNSILNGPSITHQRTRITDGRIGADSNTTQSFFTLHYNITSTGVQNTECLYTEYSK